MQTLRDEGKKSLAIFNLAMPFHETESSLLLTNLNVPLYEFGWPSRHAPSLEKLCSLCKAMDSWLSVDHGNVMIIHTRNDMSRASMAVAAYLEYIAICGGGDGMQVDEVFDYESMLACYQSTLHKFLLPSQARYIGYFRLLLAGKMNLNNRHFNLSKVRIKSIPRFDADASALCRPFLKIYQNFNLLYSSPIQIIDSDYAHQYDSIDFPLAKPVRLRGEVLIKLYHHQAQPVRTKVYMFSVQFHTGTLSTATPLTQLNFVQTDLDISLADKRFHHDVQLQLFFDDSPGQSQPIVSCFNDDQLTQYNSYEDFKQDDAKSNSILVDDGGYTKGPLDGSLYATIPKRSRTNTPTSTKDLPLGNSNDEKLLDQLLNNIYNEIESFPEIVAGDQGSKEIKESVSVREHDDLGQQHQNGDEDCHTTRSTDSSFTGSSMGGGEVSGGERSWLDEQKQKLRHRKNKLETSTNVHRGMHVISELKHKLSETEPTSSQRCVTPSQLELTPITAITTGTSRNFLNDSISLSPFPSKPLIDQNTASSHSNGHSFPVFINDTTSYWYKPHLSRDQVVHLLLDKPRGTFVIRDSNSFQGAYGLAIKVADTVGDYDAQHVSQQNSSGKLLLRICFHLLKVPFRPLSSWKQ